MATEPLTLLAVPNLSEGADATVIAALSEAVGSGAALLDRHSDPTHNRTVLTIGGTADSLIEAVTAVAAVAIERIDMGRHEGAHPCVGAIDVAPVVFVSPADQAAATAVAEALADRLADLGLPVFFYGLLGSAPGREERAFFRRGGLEALAARMSTGGLIPDLGPEIPHPTAGAVLITARPPLAAFNVELEAASIAEAGTIAASVRESGGGLPGVRAIAIDLPGPRVQISTNVHDPVAVPLAEVIERIAEHAGHFDARVAATELLGLVPEAALAAFPTEIPTLGGDVFARTIEARLAAG